MSKRTTKSTRCKGVVLTRKDRVFVGLDVHKKSYHAAVRVNGVEVQTTVLAPKAEAVLAFLEPYRSACLHVVYEAGPTGFGLARALREAQIPAEVIAPSKTPQTPARENKTDRLDCRQLALYDEKGMLRRVAVPTPQEEADRQVIRLRDQVVKRGGASSSRSNRFCCSTAWPSRRGWGAGRRHRFGRWRRCRWRRPCGSVWT